MKSVSFVAAAVLGLALSACGRDVQPEATALTTAIDAYRTAPNDGKSGAARTVRATDCSDAQVCDTKRVCLDAIDKTVRGLDLDADVARALAAMQRGADAGIDPTLPQKAKDAQALLTQGHDAMPECEKKLLQLRMKYGKAGDRPRGN